MESCSTIKRNAIMIFVTTWVKLENMMLSERSQPSEILTKLCFAFSTPLEPPQTGIHPLNLLSPISLCIYLSIFVTALLR